ncbi:MAG TPA: hypothetical protein VKE69_11140 [Planctomycetota bacterium]|nr:hypothetical protein [Planctomycetota bacterium]
MSTRSAEAQAFFDQGLTWAYAFNHEEAARSFERAATLDPSLAIGWWGVALVHGPHINNASMTEDSSRAAWEALQKAKTLRAKGSPVEQALIDAVAARYAWPAPSDRGELDRAYAAAMQTVHERYPDDLDVAALYAESLMDLQPWDLWTKEGAPKGRTLEITALLEKIMAANPRHPGATHLYIHAVEASKEPRRADAAANALRTLVPASGHLSHMPSHIDARVGRWAESAVANRRAVTADVEYRRLVPRQGFYRVYMHHNEQFLSFTCMMLGRSEEAIATGTRAVTDIPADWVKDNASVIDGYMTVRLDALKRFGKWDELLALEAPPAHLPFTTAMWRYARGVALAAKGRLDDAHAERERFEAACAAVPKGAMAQINPAATVLGLARHVLDGEIAYAARDYGVAERELRAGVEVEDGLIYMEPPDWMQPARHTLGAVLLDAGKPEEAEKTYREDLTHWPNNGWSLLGLSRALEAQGKTGDAAEAKASFERAWTEADFRPHASCLCAPKLAATPR